MSFKFLHLCQNNTLLLNNTLHKIIFLGKPFIDLQEEMKHAYAHYCKNYDDVTNLLAQVICNQV